MATAGTIKQTSAPKNDAFVEAQLDRARRRIRGLDLMTALLGFLAGTLAFALVVALLDVSFQLPTAVRGIAFGLYALSAVVYLGLAVVRPLTQRINPYFAARKVEETLPGAKNSVVNWLDLHDENLPGAIQNAVSQRAARDLQKVDFERAVSGRRAGWAGAGLGIVLLLFVLVLANVGGTKFFSHLGRAFLLGDSTPTTSTRFKSVEPKDLTVSSDQSVTIRVEIEGKRPKSVILLTRPTLADPETERPLEDRNGDEWETTLQPSEVKSGFYYRVAANDAATETYQIKVRQSPLIELDKFTATYQPRPYLGQKTPRVQRRQRDLADFRGTEVTLDVFTNRQLREGKLEIHTDDEKQSRPQVGAEIDANNLQRMRFKFVLEKSGKYQIRFTSTDNEYYTELPSRITARPDNPPVVEITKPNMDVALAANDLLQLEGLARDDVGVKELTLHMQVAGVKLQPKPYRSEKEIRLTDGGYPHVLDYKDFVDLAQVKGADDKLFLLQPKMELEYWLEAKDSCDYPSPHAAQSKRYKVTITEPRQDLQKKEEEKKKAEQQKKDHEKQQDDKLKEQNKDRQEQAKAEKEKQEKEERERKQQEADQKAEGQNPKPDKGKDGKPDDKKQDGKEDADQKRKDAEAQQKHKELEEAAKKELEKERNKQKAEGKDDNQRPGQGKDDPQKNENRDNQAGKKDEKQGEGKGKPENQPDPGKDGAKAGQDANQPQEQPGEGKKEGEQQPGDPKKGEQKDGQGQKGEQKAQAKDNPQQQGGQPQRGEGKQGDKKEGAPQAGQQKGGEQQMGGEQAQPKDAGMNQMADGKQGEGKADPAQQPGAQAKQGGQGQPSQSAGKGGPKDGDPMAGGKPVEQKDGGMGQGEDQQQARAKGDHVKGDPRNLKPAEESGPKDVEQAAQDLKNKNAGERQAARQRLEDIANKSPDGAAREAAQNELDKDRKGQNAASAKQGPGDPKKEGQCAECKGGDGQQQAQGKPGEGQQGQGKGKGSGDKKDEKGAGSAKGRAPGQKQAGDFEKSADAAQDGKADDKQRKQADDEAAQAFKKLLDDLKSNDSERREQAQNTLRELGRKAKENKNVEKTVHEKALPQAVQDAKKELEKDLASNDPQRQEQARKAVEELQRLSKETRGDKPTEEDKLLDELKKKGDGIAQRGTGGKGKQTPVTDPANPDGSKSDGRHQQYAGDMSWEKLPPALRKKKLEEKGWTEKDVAQAREWRKRMAEAESKDEPAAIGKGKPLPGGSIDQVLGPDGKPKAIGSADQGLPPLEYRDVYREFTKRFQEKRKDK